VKIKGELAELMQELSPSFKIKNYGFMYLKCIKALYGLLEAARLYYDNLIETLTS
jgi:hypothetical protein